jgi:hypothetical protein
MSKSPNLYQLFGPASLLNLQRLMKEGKVPAPEQLAEVLEANAGQPLPSWFVTLVALALRGKLKKKRGRPLKADDDPYYAFQFQLAAAKYEIYLKWLQKRQRSLGLKGWSAVRGKDFWTGAPHEMAARMAIASWLPYMNWNSFLNEVSRLKKKDSIYRE